jgi:hypothetical protein
MAYANSPPFAWAGWRLRIPGEPVGGQYHGFLANDNAFSPPLELGEAPAPGLGGDSRGPWSNVWTGIPLKEGETLSDYIYRSPAEVPPRPNASGGVNTVRSLQTAKAAGYAEAPGNYFYLDGMGAIINPYVDGAGATTRITPRGGPVYPVSVRSGAGDSVVTHPYDPIVSPHPVCPAWGCGNPPVAILPFGPTSTVPQPPPPAVPVVAPSVPLPAVNPITGQCSAGYYRDAAGNCTNDWRNPYSVTLQAPAPSPSVPASPSDYLPAQGQVVPGITPAASSIMDWLSSSSIWSAVPNGVLLAGAGVALFAMSQRRGR